MARSADVIVREQFGNLMFQISLLIAENEALKEQVAVLKNPVREPDIKPVLKEVK